MRPLVIRGHVWRVVRVIPGDPLLVDRTGTSTIATTDPLRKVIRISTSVPLSMFDRVYLHEVAHAIMDETGVTELLSAVSDRDRRILFEETLAWFLETHAIEAIDAASRSLGRPVCVDGTCIGG